MSRKRSTKEKIPAAVRNTVWNTYIGVTIKQSTCLCCTLEPITFANFHCGHIKSEKNGGSVNIDNLRPICGHCNSSMGATNMDVFIKKYKFKGNINTDNTKNVTVSSSSSCSVSSSSISSSDSDDYTEYTKNMVAGQDIMINFLKETKINKPPTKNILGNPPKIILDEKSLYEKITNEYLNGDNNLEYYVYKYGITKQKFYNLKDKFEKLNSH